MIPIIVAILKNVLASELGGAAGDVVSGIGSGGSGFVPATKMGGDSGQSLPIDRSELSGLAANAIGRIASNSIAGDKGQGAGSIDSGIDAILNRVKRKGQYNEQLVG